MTQRRDYIDELKGLGILLVVFGHFMEQYRMGYSFVSASFFCIYAFHMALFCTCSGLVAQFSPCKLVTQQLWLYAGGAGHHVCVPRGSAAGKFCRERRRYWPRCCCPGGICGTCTRWCSGT